MFKRRWSDILRFRSKSLFTSCEVCTVLKQQLNDKSHGVEAKLDILKAYRQHLHSQYSDRTCLWMLQSQSCEPNCEVLYIATDGLDQAKFSLPRHPDLRASASVHFGVKTQHVFIISWPLGFIKPVSLSHFPPNPFHPAQGQA